MVKHNKNHILKKITILLIVLSVFVFLNIMTVTATTIKEIHVQNESRVVTIKGQVVPPMADQYVALEILHLNKQAKDADMPQSEPVTQVFSIIDQTKTDANGNYQFKVKMKGRSGIYTLRIWVDGVKQLEEATFRYSDPEEVKQAIRAINACNSIEGPQGIIKILDEYKEALNFDYSLFNQLKDKTLVYQTLIDEPDFEETDLDGVQNVFNTAVVLQKLNEEEDDVKFSQLMEDYSDLLKYTETSAYSTYSTVLDLIGQELVKKELMRKTFSRSTDFVTSFCEYTIIQAIARVRGWAEVNEIISTNKDFINIDMTSYNQLSSDKRQKVDKALSGKVFPSLKAIKEEFEKAVQEQLESDSSTTPRTSRSGGGGSTFIHAGQASEVIPKTTQEPKPVTGNEFKDIESVPWAVESIRSLADKGIINGKSEGIFAPNDYIKREEYIKMLMLAFELVDDSSTATFSDIEEGAWYYKYISSAQKAGICKGFSDGSFGLGKEITRQEMVVLAYRTAVYCKKNFEAKVPAVSFNDADKIHDYALDSITVMQQAGIINGTDDGNFLPHSFCTRAEAAKVIYELMKL
mgnify:FL=1